MDPIKFSVGDNRTLDFRRTSNSLSVNGQISRVNKYDEYLATGSQQDDKFRIRYEGLVGFGDIKAYAGAGNDTFEISSGLQKPSGDGTSMGGAQLIGDFSGGTGSDTFSVSGSNASMFISGDAPVAILLNGDNRNANLDAIRAIDTIEYKRNDDFAGLGAMDSSTGARSNPDDKDVLILQGLQSDWELNGAKLSNDKTNTKIMMSGIEEVRFDDGVLDMTKKDKPADNPENATPLIVVPNASEQPPADKPAENKPPEEMSSQQLPPKTENPLASVMGV